VLEIDGAARGNPGPAGAGYLISKKGKVLAQGKRHLGVTTNNVAEYTALLEGLRKALSLGARDLEVQTDSLLVLRQIEGSYKVRKEHLKGLHRRCIDLISQLRSFSIRYVPSEKNRAHALAHEAASEAGTRNSP